MPRGVQKWPESKNMPIYHTCYVLNSKIEWQMQTKTCALPALSQHCREQAVFGEFLPTRPCCFVWFVNIVRPRYTESRSSHARKKFPTRIACFDCFQKNFILKIVKTIIFSSILQAEHVKLNTTPRKSEIKQI